MTDDLCSDCGAELDGYSPCACAIDGIKRDPRHPARESWSMRQMVHRKLDRQQRRAR